MQQFVLKHYQQFDKQLRNYQISDRAKTALVGLKLVLLVAPTSTGRNTIIRHLIKTGKYHFIVSDTTRPPQLRDGKMETSGVEYFFRSEQSVLDDLLAGEFLEAAIIHEQQVSGISIRELEKANNQNEVAITDIEIVGANNVIKVKPDTKVIFLLPPSFEEWQKRITSRAQMSKQEITNRLRGADKELMAVKKYDYYNFVIANDVQEAARIIDDIAHGKPNPHQQAGLRLVTELHKKLQAKLT